MGNSQGQKVYCLFYHVNDSTNLVGIFSSREKAIAQIPKVTTILNEEWEPSWKDKNNSWMTRKVGEDLSLVEKEVL